MLCAQYLSKGRTGYIEGRLQTRGGENRGGQKQKTTEIVAQRMLMLGGRGPDQGGAEADKETPEFAAETVKIEDDDLPF